MSYDTGNPIGSKSPKDLYDNAENFDEAVNDRSSTEWTDRFGYTRKTWSGIEQSVDEIGGTRGPATAGIGVRLRLPDAPASITASLAGGSIGSRPAAPEGFNYIGYVSTGSYYDQDIPGLVARRAMTPLSPNEKDTFRVSILTGVRQSSQPFEATYQSGVAWYDNWMEALTADTFSLFTEAKDLTDDAGFEQSFTFGVEGSGADIEAPEDAVYAIPFYEFVSGTGRSYAAELNVERVNVAVAMVDSVSESIADTALSATTVADVGGEFHNSVHEAESQPIIMSDDGKGILNLDEDGFLDVRLPSEFFNDDTPDVLQITNEEGTPIARFHGDGGLIGTWIEEFYNGEDDPATAYVDEKMRVAISWDEEGSLAGTNPKDVADVPTSPQNIGPGEVWNDDGKQGFPRRKSALVKDAKYPFGKSHTGLFDALDGWALDFPNYMTMTVEGTLTTGEEIRKYELFPNEYYLAGDEEKKAVRPTIMLVGGIHGGSEQEATNSDMKFIETLLYHWHESSVMSWLRWNARIVYVPTANPTGYDLDQRRNQNGVDLNRNFPHGWTPASDHGDSAGSEDETQILMQIPAAYSASDFASITHHNFYSSYSTRLFWFATVSQEGWDTMRMASDDVLPWIMREYNGLHESIGNDSMPEVRLESPTVHGGLDYHTSIEYGVDSFLCETCEQPSDMTRQQREEMGTRILQAMIFRACESIIGKNINLGN